MKLSSLVRGKVGTVAAVGAVAAIAGTGASVAAGQITSAQIKDGTIQTGDLTKNNFAQVHRHRERRQRDDAGQHRPGVRAGPAWSRCPPTPRPGWRRWCSTRARGRSTAWPSSGTWVRARPTGADYGVVTIPGFQGGFGTNFTADVPDGGSNAAQTAFHGTIKITANDTPIVITGAFTGSNTGQAGVTVSATQYVYVKQFKNGQPT